MCGDDQGDRGVEARTSCAARRQARPEAARRAQGFGAWTRARGGPPGGRATEPTTFHDRLSGLYARAVTGQGRPTTSARNARAIKGDLKTLANDATLAADPDVARLQRRIRRHLGELVAFVRDPALEGTNNRAEREFRPHAQARHRSGGARSERGAQTYATNLSVVRTAHLNGTVFVAMFAKARVAFHGGGEFPSLFPPQTKPSPPAAALN
jgi:hypothetical protein